MPARRSTAASATSLPTSPSSSSRPGSMPAISKIAMGRPLCSPRSATCSPGCAMSLPMAAMPAVSWRRLWPDTGSGRSRSSSGPIEPRDFSSCHDAGWSSELSPGSIATAAWPKTSRQRPSAARPGFTLPPSNCSHAGSLALQPIALWRKIRTIFTIPSQALIPAPARRASIARRAPGRSSRPRRAASSD